MGKQTPFCRNTITTSCTVHFGSFLNVSILKELLQQQCQYDYPFSPCKAIFQYFDGMFCMQSILFYFLCQPPWCPKHNKRSILFKTINRLIKDHSFIISCSKCSWNDMGRQIDELKVDASMECVWGKIVSLKGQSVSTTTHSLKLLDTMQHWQMGPIVSLPWSSQQNL